ncbi:hypothetical protein RhiJN_17421 [Ceratobasidium sp. AG-Ba]|nr:hypothetical protein RhiJN_17421 [Ceratobasidium sp. AG-Ba]
MWTTSLFTLVLNVLQGLAKLCRRRRNKCQPANPSPPLPKLPAEVVERCADFLFEMRLSVERADGTCFISVKPAWIDVSAFMLASPGLHRMGLARWLSVLTIRQPGDWQCAVHYQLFVRELRCLDGAFNGVRNRNIIAEFRHLHTLSIDAHGDVVYDQHDRFTYRDLFSSLPPSLRRLEILRAHGPDINTINAVKDHAPSLEELRLGRCTLFNNPGICDFWQTFPLEHDSYMSIEDTDSYAKSLTRELAPLQSLQVLALGLYLVPSTTILAHRLYHRRSMVAPEVIVWQQAIALAEIFHGVIPDEADLAQIPAASVNQLISVLHEPDPLEEFGQEGNCSLCIDAVLDVGHDAEARASVILKSQLPCLTQRYAAQAIPRPSFLHESLKAIGD